MPKIFLKRLELHGFKSFASKTILEFPSTITAIVGPNGSGKSNVIDGMRWVLGERGAKELRGASLENLIFAGTPKKPQSSLARVTFCFNNNHKVFPFDSAEVTLERKVNRAGVSQFFLNDSETKLKDITPILAKARLGSRGITMVGQGQSDLFVKCDTNERRFMIEEVLGLKEFRIKKEQAERRLESSFINMDKVKAMLEELAPHLRFLRKQKSRFAKRAELEASLKELENKYFGIKYKKLCQTQKILAEPIDKLKKKIREINKEVEILEHQLKEIDKKISEEDKTAEIRKTVVGLIEKRSLLEKELARLEVKIEVNRNAENKDLPIGETISFVKNLNTEIREVIQLQDIEKIKSRLKSWLDRLNLFFRIDSKNSGDIAHKEKIEVENEIKKIDSEIKKIGTLEDNFAAAQKKFNHDFRIQVQRLEMKKNEMSEFERQKQAKIFECEKSDLKVKELEREWLTAGRNREDWNRIIENSPGHLSDGSFSFDDASRKMFKMRTELAAIGEIDPALAQEAAESEERFNFLTKELNDLEKAIDDLRTLIKNLGEKINSDFKTAFKAINEEFNKYCRLMFGGGKAKLKIVKKEKKITPSVGDPLNSETTGEKETEEKNKEEVESGVEIELNLPGKKISNLDMLSGGEKSLVSLAALFALIAVSPPPFLVLDEIDAALDEENARRFAELIKDFSKRTQFVIVTHNRITMETADVLYGITIAEDGTSKVLSLKFETAKT